METLIVLVLLLMLGIYTLIKTSINLVSRLSRGKPATSKSLEEGSIQEIRRAMAEREFVMYYQPQYSLTTNKVIGVEALIRWKHPEKGLVTPNDFIPLAESTGLIIPLGEYILRETCKQYVEWGEDDLNISVNLSAKQFLQPDLAERIAVILEEEGMKPQNLILEITETTSMENLDVTQRVLQDLKDLGVNISLDDFGVGYSSFAYLKDFPITTIKIDRSFVWEITKNKEGKAIVETIVKMAKTLDLGVVAEGVEVKEQLSILKDFACDYIQGYILSPPIPSDKFIAKLNNGELVLK